MAKGRSQQESVARSESRDLSRPTARLQGFVVIALLAIVGVIVTIAHWPVLSAQALALDDQQYIRDNPLVQHPSWASVGRFFGEVFEPSTVAGYYQPLSMTALMLDTALGGRPDDLRQYHRSALLLHVANTVLVVLVLYQLLGNIWAAAGVGLLFGVHPMTVEPTAWVADRKTLLATLFALGSLLAYIAYARRASKLGYGFCAGLFVLALLSKPTSTPLPVLLLLLDYWPLRRLSWRKVVEKAPLFLIAGIGAVVTVVSQGRAAGLTGGTAYDPVRIVLTICHNIAFYLRDTVWPVSLTWHHPFPEPFTASQPLVLAGLLATPVLLALVLLSWRWTRAALVGVAIFCVAIFPTLGVVGFTYVIAADKFAYWPAVGLLLPLAAVLHGLRRRRAGRVAGMGLIFVLVVAEAWLTRDYISRWRDTEQLHRYALAQVPQAYAVRYNLGAFLHEQGRLEEAQAELERVLAQRPDHWRAHSALGAVLHARGQADAAIAHLQAAVRLNPNGFPAQYNLGVFLAEQQRMEEACTHYRAATRIRPDDFRAHTNLGNALNVLGRRDEALAQYDEALRLRPDYARGHYNRGALLMALGRTADAMADFRRALEIDPNHAGARQQLEALAAPPPPAR